MTDHRAPIPRTTNDYQGGASLVRAYEVVGLCGLVVHTGIIPHLGGTIKRNKETPALITNHDAPEPGVILTRRARMLANPPWEPVAPVAKIVVNKLTTGPEATG